MTSKDLIILGIDPGYDRCGVAVVKNDYPKASIIYSACLTTHKTSAFSDRLLHIGTELEKTIKEYRPHAIALETLFVTKSVKTATKVGEVRGVILYLAAQNNIPVAEFAPATIKLSVTGSGNAPKDQVITMVGHLTNLIVSKQLDDEYDAIAIALTGLSHHRSLSY